MNDDLNLTLKLLSDFRKNDEKRTLSFLVYNALSKILNLHIDMWTKEFTLFAKGNKPIEEASLYTQLTITLSNLIHDITTRVLEEDGMESFKFFEDFSRHITEKKDYSVEIKDHKRYYIEDLLRSFYQIFFDKIYKSTNKLHIWDAYFPDEWKIRAQTLEENQIQKITMNLFLQWAERRIADGKTYDMALEDMATELFPDVDPVWWAAILTFALHSADPRNRFDYIVKSNWIFGGVGRIRAISGYWETDEARDKAFAEMRESTDSSERASTISLLRILIKLSPLFSSVFAEVNVQQYISYADSLRYGDGTLDAKRATLLEIFKSLQKQPAT